jgi:hypothetical protein
MRGRLYELTDELCVLGRYGQGGATMSVHKGVQDTPKTRIMQSNVNETNA